MEMIDQYHTLATSPRMNMGTHSIRGCPGPWAVLNVLKILYIIYFAFSEFWHVLHCYRFVWRWLNIQGDSGGICNNLGNDSMCDSKQKSSHEHGSDFEQLLRYVTKKIWTILRAWTPLDFCLWGWLKGEVYRTKVDTRADLVARASTMPVSV